MLIFLQRWKEQCFFMGESVNRKKYIDCKTQKLLFYFLFIKLFAQCQENIAAWKYVG